MRDWIGDNHFFLTNGDELKEIDLRQMAKFHDEVNPLGTIALVEVPNPQEYGVAICNEHLIEEFLEKHHEYSVPFIGALDVHRINLKYREWMNSVVSR